MDILPVNFYVFRFCGAWREHKENSFVTRFFNFCYRYSIVILIHYFTMAEIIQLVLVRNDMENLIESLVLTLTMTTLCMKYLNFLGRQHKVRNLLDCFRIKLCQPRNAAEELILRQYDRRAKRITCFYMFLCYVSGLLIFIVPLLSEDKRRLPRQLYVPYSIDALFPYMLTYLQQCVALIYGVSLNVSFDSLVYGFIIQSCAQIDLLCHRLTETFRSLWENNERRKIIERLAIVECVQHQISVYNMIHEIQSLFVWIIAILFFFSLITLCSIIYQMSKNEIFNPEFFSCILYLGAMLFQTFLYCWYGNELDLKNKRIADAIYISNWTVVSTKERKSLLFIMMMSQRGKILSFHGMSALVLDTFTWITKTSYSIFNLLQQSSN